MPRRRPGAMFGASIAGIVNSNARSDEEARTRVVRLFGSILGLLFAFDIGCSFAVLWIQCNASVHQENESLSKCIERSILHGFAFRPMMGGDDTVNDESNFGDLFLLSVARLALTFVLLLSGARYARPKQDEAEGCLLYTSPSPRDS